MESLPAAPPPAPEVGAPNEGRGAFGGFIGPRTLIANVRVAAPYLFDGTHARLCELEALAPDAAGPCERAHGRLGWWRLLLDPRGLVAEAEPSAAARTDYFALCLAAHHASVATYVPTDVDAKIRHALWFEQEDEHEHARMRALASAHGGWELAGFSARLVALAPELGGGHVSGHDGERLSVWCGAMLSSFHHGWEGAARELEERVAAELEREAHAFLGLARRRGAELDLLRVAAALTHNAGDVDQALALSDAPARALRGPRGAGVEGARVRQRFGELATRAPERFGGAFARAAALYRELLAPEGHRHYPLRAARCLRTHPELLLPIGPFLDDWGERLARWPAFGERERAEVVGALLDGCRRVPGQQGYFRALAGLERELPGGLARLAPALSSAPRKELKDAHLRQRLAVPRLSFESSYTKRARRRLEA
jgi:hypothetical protein